MIIIAQLTVGLLLCLVPCVTGQSYQVDDLIGFGRRFDGIGGLSGGCATSKLLIGYPQKQRDEVLDYLFKPKFGASLQILKVEIGGDAPGSAATESSHMHNSWDENYDRGYEWWMMKEAKKRNPNIKLYGLSWTFPGWIGKGTQNPYTDINMLADYTCRWVNGAKVHHNLTIDYVGIWNERYCDVAYIEVLRKMLDSRGLNHTGIVAGDDDWGNFPQVYNNSVALAASYALGGHYPGTISPEKVIKLGKPLWSSEDYSSFNDKVGGGCWARILNQNYVTGFMTSTIAWNLIDSFYEGLPWDRDSLMTAREPWSGYYIVESPIWMSAHTTQLTEIGWHYLPHNHGVGMLKYGGSYVSLVSPDAKDLTIVIETMTREHSKCIRPHLPPYSVTPQTVNFTLDGSFRNVKQLYVWYSMLQFGAGNSTYFKELKPIQVINGVVTLKVNPDEVYSLTTLNDGHHGDFSPPPSAPFPRTYFDDFESYPLSAEPYLLTPQQGACEVVDSGDAHGKVARQAVIQIPVASCPPALFYNSSIFVIGSMNWTDVIVEVDARVGDVNGSNAFFVAARVNKGGCDTYSAKGVYLFLYPKNQTFVVTSDIHGKQIITRGENKAIREGWNHVTLFVQGQTAVGTCNGITLFNENVPSTPPGFAGLGTDIYGISDFDNLRVTDISSVRSLHREDQHSSHGQQPKPLYFSSEDEAVDVHP